jgi:probable rRNA maturation factor
MTARKPAPGIVTDVLVEAGNWPAEEELTPLAERAVGAAASKVKPVLPGDSELSIVFTDDAHIRLLNRKFRDKDGATNVLSFPAPSPGPGRFGPLLGDIVLARETIEREAVLSGLTVEGHLTHLIVHGFLHLLGYDHLDDAGAAIMEGLETAILASLDIADPYADD